MHKFKVIEEVTDKLLLGEDESGRNIINQKYPFQQYETFHRSYTLTEKMNIFLRDGFIDRYTGDQLIIPGLLKALSIYYPKEFPYHKHWKMSESHLAYWELAPTIDHVVPIAVGGKDEESNWVTTSMLNNSIKSNWTLQQIHWTLHDKGSLSEWDGLTRKFIMLVDNNSEFLKDDYISKWYNVAIKCV